MSNSYTHEIVDFTVQLTFREVRATRARGQELGLDLADNNPVLALAFLYEQQDSCHQLIDGLARFTQKSFRASEIMELCSMILGTCKEINHLIDCAETEHRCLNGAGAGEEAFGTRT